MYQVFVLKFNFFVKNYLFFDEVSRKADIMFVIKAHAYQLYRLCIRSCIAFYL